MRIFLFLALIVALLIPAFPALAQDATETDAPPTDVPTPAPTDEPAPVDPSEPSVPGQVISVNEAAELLLAALAAIVAGGLGQAPITTFLVSIAKRFPFFSRTDGRALQLVIGGLLTAIFWFATRFGYEAQFRQISDFVLVVAPAVLNLFATFTGSSALYHMATKARDPLFGYKRT